MSQAKKFQLRVLALFISLLLGKVGLVYGQSMPSFTIYDIGTSSPAPKTIIIRWTTDALADSQVEYGLDETYGQRSDPDRTKVFSHAVQITNIKPDLIYYFRAVSADDSGRRVVSPRFVFSVPSSPKTASANQGAMLKFSAPRDRAIQDDSLVTFTYQTDGVWPSAERIPHIYLWADALRNGTWVERALAFDVGGTASAASRSGSFTQTFSPGTYRISGLIAAARPNHEALTDIGVSRVIFTVQDVRNTEASTASSSVLLSLPSSPRLGLGERIRNWRAADVRQIPSRPNSLIGVQAVDTKGTIIGGPETVGGLRWWNINYDVGYDGWTSQDSLLPVNAPVFDFDLVALQEGGVSVVQGSSVDFSLGGKLIAGSSQPIAFTADGLPAGAYAVFSPPSCALPCLTTLHISTLRSMPAGVYPVTVNAVSAKQEKKLSFKIQITRFLPIPSVSLDAPFISGIVPGSSLLFSSRVTGDADLAGARFIHFRLDGGAERIDALLNGSRMFTGLSTGSHALTGYLTGNRDVKIPGSDFSLSFVSDASLPVISGLNTQHVIETSAAIVWNTDKNSTTRIAYDGVKDLRFSTSEFDSGSRQQTHTVRLQNLIPCTGYFYRAYSKNAAGGESTSQINRFSTTGCLASMSPTLYAGGIISALPQRTLTLAREGERLISITLPPDMPDSAAVQINGLDPAGIGSAVPPPASQLRLVGAHAYRIAALRNPSTSIFSAEKPASIVMRYLPRDVTDILPGSMKIWRWTGVNWTETKQCRTSEAVEEVSCATEEISSVFALFGASSRLSLAPPPGSLILSALPKAAPGSLTGEKAMSINMSTPPVPRAIPQGSLSTISRSPVPPRISAPSQPVAAPVIQTDVKTLTRNLYRGVKHAEVALLQRFLISQRYLPQGSNSGLFDGATEAAVRKFQCDREIICEGTQSTTGYGSIDARTREKINPLLK